jgi:very-short-patch-repair endonuclease
MGVSVSSPIDAWVECRDLLDLDDLVVMGDALVGRWSKFNAASGLPLSTLVEAVDAAPARNVRRLRAALQLIRPRAHSPAETRLRLLLVRSGLPEPVLNYEATSASGEWLGRVDMAYPSRRISIEYEGEHHFQDPAQYRKDIERRERFADAGWRTIRVTSDHVLHPEVLIARVARHLGVDLP